MCYTKSLLEQHIRVLENTHAVRVVLVSGNAGDGYQERLQEEFDIYRITGRGRPPLGGGSSPLSAHQGEPTDRDEFRAAIAAVQLWRYGVQTDTDRPMHLIILAKLLRERGIYGAPRIDTHRTLLESLWQQAARLAAGESYMEYDEVLGVWQEKDWPIGEGV